MVVTVAATTSGTAAAVEAGGLTGFVLDVVRAIGEVGVALLVLVENIVPPIPSEVVLPFAGALVADGHFTFVGVLAASTAGSVLGAVVLYELGRRVGPQRVAAGLAKVPLVRRSDVDEAAEWFRRHGRVAVLSGRLVPGVRSVISIPAGAQRMPRGQFLLLTTLGTAGWNALLIGAGLLLGQRWQTVGRYTQWIDVALWGLLGLVVVRLLHRRFSDA